MKYLSLFSGIGGFELGIKQAYENIQKLCIENKGKSERTSPRDSEGQCEQLHKLGNEGLSCIGFSEIDKYATEIYQKHFPNHKNYGDITKINEKELPDFDLLVGGFPCQAFSIAGKRGGFEDTRGTLFFDVARIIKEKQPRIVMLENVKGLLSHDKGNTFRTIISTLDELGYDIQWQVLNSKNHGVPQNRERVFIIGHLRGTSRPEVFPFGGTEFNDNAKIKVVGDLDHSTWGKRNESIRRVYNPNGVAPTIPTGTGGGVMPKIVSPSNRRTEFNTSDISNTLTSHYRGSPDGDGRPGVIVNPYNGKTSTTETGTLGTSCGTATGKTAQHLHKDSKIRRLTPIECERLQGFPDNWTEGISDTQRYKCCGNAVTVNVIRDIMAKLLA